MPNYSLNMDYFTFASESDSPALHEEDDSKKPGIYRGTDHGNSEGPG